ncbi:antibiotic biosynthesis monooxygenase family protein [Candidatus Methanoperedens nitratireducens]|uniref:ABM domain-containing protein n=1 Tax=Candidatus Methanoperedens nitratireducens TaxID=1392998 RepID=A0A284VUN8_9EURY|nr:antibiotic biosynthesis monooxygenase [Candidatus Methanoperedens nitroreducens]SNQ62898.1 hypothetical protein MNV_970004 [Candidatus Methanoperedens nitroreducens]
MNKVETTYGRQKVKSRNTETNVAIAIILVVLGAGYVVARPGSSGSWGGMMGGNWDGNGMMGSHGNGNDHCGTGDGYTGSGYGANATPITIEKAREAVEKYLASTGNTDLRLTEVMEFDERATVRKASGSRGGRLLRNADNPNEIVMILEWDSIENARKLVASDDLKKAIKRAGVIGEPEFYLLDEVDKVPV